MSKTIIIAEAGVNHNGNIDNAIKLIDIAVEAGVDYVKFQTFKASNIASINAKKAQYQEVNTGGAEGQLEMLRRLELSEEDHFTLYKYCSSRGIKFLSTPFDLESIDLIKSLNVSVGKVPSGEITNLPYLRQMARAFPEIILSTGMCTHAEVRDALNVLYQNGLASDNITVLHCTTEYPTPFEDVNLRAMVKMGEDLNVKIGYSDHTLGIEVPIAAVALGAKIIEKHFTLDRMMDGPDHKASLEPAELKQMVTAIRNIEVALGNSTKMPSLAELKNISIARKSIVANKFIAKGDLFSNDNLAIKRPGSGISPMKWDEVIGKSSPKDFNKDDLIEL